MSKVFVLGAFGFVGKALCKSLSQFPEIDVITEIRYFDDKYDCIINLAAVTDTSTAFNPKLIESNFILVDKVFKRSDRIIQASSCSAKYPETSPYAQSKAWCEHLCIKHGRSVALRFFNIYGPGATRGIVKYLMDAKDGAQIIIRGPELIRDYIFINDIVNEILFYLNTSKILLIGIREVGTGIGTTTRNLVNLYMELSGKRFTINEIAKLDHEPLCMVSNTLTDALPLDVGLKKMIEYKKN